MNTSTINQQFTNTLLQMARNESKAAGVKVGKLTTWSTKMGQDRWFEVYEEGKEGIAWSGRAFNAAEAKQKYLTGLLP